MNIRIFSLLSAILIFLIAILGGTYYYLFEYSKAPKYENLSPVSNSLQKTEEIPQINTQNITQTNEQEANISQEKKEENLTTAQEIPQIPNPTNLSPKEEPKKEANNEPKNPLKLVSNSQKTKSKLSTIKEYQQRGKDSRLEPQLSSETIKVYVLDGKALSDYRINLLKDMLKPVQSRSKDYNLSIFIEMLPKSEMSISIYNKDIIFSERKKSYKSISMEKLKPYLNEPESINEKVKREEAIQRVNFQIKSEAKGSSFSKHIKSLKNGLAKAQYFFPFCEIIYIDSQK